ncbi:MAG: hypothetical protein ACRECH_14415, partial [Nitrososphaerales archaeon]
MLLPANMSDHWEIRPETKVWFEETLSEVVEMTPYEKFLRESLSESKMLQESLVLEIQKAGRIRKRFLNTRLAEINQNIQ